MSRGLDGRPRGDMSSARRKKARREAAAHAQREKRRRLKVTERKHASGFLRAAVGVAKQCARDHGWSVQVERTNDAGNRVRFQWSKAAIELVSTDISIQFELGDRRGSGSSSTIRVYEGRKLTRTCPPELLQSGDGRAFTTWLSDGLDVAVARAASKARD